MVLLTQRHSLLRLLASDTTAVGCVVAVIALEANGSLEPIAEVQKSRR
ncbi:hypothetical protein RBSH_02948 [Rhodopirellula baltica SH28]|uniref:Uncharacterized protein n=1 Tax=Rhodopirellula baltica SH28 TaxID=993517 RepID=K5DG09_RHOBT|nr:hypothetical protein RBSH_02948 [Rhodopirellula baltica SH28]